MECFAYRLALQWRVPYPDDLIDALTWDQFSRWQQYDAQEPFGEVRADMRAAANSLFLASHGEADVELMHPYWRSAEDLGEKIASAERLKARLLAPEHQAKLKAMREKHLAEQAKRGG